MSTDLNDVETLLRHKETCTWVGGYGSIPEIIKDIGAKTILEVGVAYGYHAHHIIDNCDIKYVGVDPYPSMYDPTDPFIQDVTRMFKLSPDVDSDRTTATNRLYEAVRESLRRKNQAAEIHRVGFLEFSKAFSGRKFDLIYVDGDHREEAVMVDITLSLLHISDSGVVCGDDIEIASVKSAVLRIASYFKREVLIHKHTKTMKNTWILR